MPRSDPSLKSLIAEAIHGADRSYFFEDYTKQADAVLQRLRREGYVVVPDKPSEAMVEAGVEAIQAGKLRPAVHVAQIYRAMARAGGNAT